MANTKTTTTHKATATKKGNQNVATGTKKPAAKTSDAPQESKREKFERLANRYVNDALHKITRIGKLSGSAYERNPNDVKQIENALIAAVKDVTMRLNGAKKTADAFTIGSESAAE